MSAKDELLNRLVSLENLNPELSGQERQSLYDLASQLGPDAFADAAAETEKIIGLYLGSPVKRVGRDILAEYFQELERGERLLAEAGEISKPSETAERQHSVISALVRYSSDELSCLDRCKVLSRTEIPQPLTRAADAFRRRLEVVDTVMEICFQVLWRLDEEKCQQWFLSYFDKHEGELDPDVLRDILRVALERGTPNAGLLLWAEKWSGDEALQEYWPYMVEYSDRLLCREALKCWQKHQSRPKNHFLAHLNLLIRNGSFADENLQGWGQQAMEGIGECVQRFMDVSVTPSPLESLLPGNRQKTQPSPEDDTWKHTMLFGELQRMTSLLKPIMITADQLLRTPDGATNLAMAVLGLAGEGLDRWEDHCLKLCERAVLHAFLIDLRDGRSPIETIRRLTFDDNVAFNHMCAELDLVSQRFDSLKQRDKVVSLLAVFYASYRRADLLGAEVSRRYRNLRRLLHEDFWRGHLEPEQLQTLQTSGILRDFDSLTAAARKFLDRRRALDASVEEMIASEMEFTRYVRQLRMVAIKEEIALQNH